MFRPRHLVLISALALATPALAGADPQGRNAPWSRGDDRGYGYGNYGYNSNFGFRNGLNDGYEAGLNDARNRRQYDPVGERRYRSADRGYERRYGSKDAYKYAYRDGFREGYDRGYREGRRYDNRRDRDRRGFFGGIFRF